MGPDTFTVSESEQLPEELQFLADDKKRDPDLENLKTHLETLLLLTTTRAGREVLRSQGVYLVIRELHQEVEDEGVREGCERLVQVLMRDEEGEGRVNEMGVGEEGMAVGEAKGRMVMQREEGDGDEEEEVVEIF